MILFDDVFKNYPNGTNALNGVSFEIQDGEFVFIIGPSGAGKSTMIKLLLREERHSSGKIIVNDFNLNKMKNGKIPMLRRSMGVVFQDFRLIETMTVYENVAFAMRVIGCSNKTIRRRVPYVLGIVGLGHKSKNYPKELSGGEQQRVALARALVNNPKTIIADEPTAGLNRDDAAVVLGLLKKAKRDEDRKRAIIVVTDNPEVADQMEHCAELE